MDDLLVCLIAGGHMLLEGVPGIAKTTLAKTFSEVTGLKYRRIQFTQDVLPADITGHYYFNQQTSKFEFRKGPLFSEVILVDEINRAPPKTQSALLEAMEERQVTIEGNTFKLPELFMVIATLNPIEVEGVYPLPEAQVDRFMYKTKMDYISQELELQMLTRKSKEELTGRSEKSSGGAKINTSDNLIGGREFIRTLIEYHKEIYVHRSIVRYIRDIIIETRNTPSIALGASPRAGEHMVYAAKAYGLIHGRDYVIPDDVKAVAPKILNHRLLLAVDTELGGITVESLIEDTINRVKVPKGEDEVFKYRGKSAY